MPFSIRLKIGEEPLRFQDMVRGPVEFQAEAVSDPILVRSGTEAEPGIPVYNFVVTVDDALMKITHDDPRRRPHFKHAEASRDLRGFRLGGADVAHLSTILGGDRERLSKRHGATSIATFREMGYLPEALVNYLALLGWGEKMAKPKPSLSPSSSINSLGTHNALSGPLRL